MLFPFSHDEQCHKNGQTYLIIAIISNIQVEYSVVKRLFNLATNFCGTVSLEQFSCLANFSPVAYLYFLFLQEQIKGIIIIAQCCPPSCTTCSIYTGGYPFRPLFGLRHSAGVLAGNPVEACGKWGECMERESARARARERERTLLGTIHNGGSRTWWMSEPPCARPGVPQTERWGYSTRRDMLGPSAGSEAV